MTGLPDTDCVSREELTVLSNTLCLSLQEDEKEGTQELVNE